MKEYIVRIPMVDASYKLTGSGGNAPSQFSASVTQSAFVSNKSAGISVQVAIPPNRKLKVKGARLYTESLPVEGSSGFGLAGDFLISIAKDDNADAFGSFSLSISKWNEWENKDIDVTLSAEEEDLDEKGKFRFETGSGVYVYDNNVQDSLIGETITPVLEMLIETDVIVDASTGLAI